MLTEFPTAYATAFIAGWSFVFLLGVWVTCLSRFIGWLRHLGTPRA